MNFTVGQYLGGRRGGLLSKLQSFFLTDGFVSLNTDPEIKCPIKIWRDTGAFQSVMLHNVLPFTEKSALGSHALVKGFGEGFLT